MRIITQTTKDEVNPLFDVLNPLYNYKKHIKF